MANGPTELSPTTLLGGLPRELSDKLLLGKPIILRKGKTLFERGDAGDGCYWLRQGVVAVSAMSAMGDQRTLAILGPGALIGELAMIDGLPRSASVAAIRDCTLTFVGRTAFKAMLLSHPEIYMNIVALLSARLRHSDEEMIASSFLSVQARVARALLQFARHIGEETEKGRVAIRHKVTQRDLAAMAGVARESVSRTISAWKKANIIEGSPRTRYLVNIGRLEREATAMEPAG